MNNYYYNEYELLVDLPTGEKKGDHFFAHTNDKDELYFKVGKLSDYMTRENEWYKDYKTNGITLPLDKMTDKFFKPVGKKKPLYPKFPSKNKIQEYYYLIGENRLVNDVDIVRAINPIFYSDEFYDKVYELLKQMYNDRYFSNGR